MKDTKKLRCPTCYRKTYYKDYGCIDSFCLEYKIIKKLKEKK